MNSEAKKALIIVVSGLLIVAGLVVGLIALRPPPPPRPTVTAITQTPAEPPTAVAPAVTPAPVPSKPPAAKTADILACLPTNALVIAQFNGKDRLRDAYHASALGQILQDPQLKAMVAQAKDAAQSNMSTLDDAIDFPVAQQLLKTALCHPSVAGLYLQDNPAMVVCIALGQDAGPFEANLLMAAAKKQTGPVATRSHDGHTIRMVLANIEWAVAHNIFVLATVPELMNATLARLNAAQADTHPSPPALPSVAIGERIGWMNLDAASLVNIMKSRWTPHVDSPESQAQMDAILNKLGVDNLQSISAQAGFDGPGIRVWSRLQTANGRRGLFDLYGRAGPIDDTVLRQVPQDVAKAVVSRLDLATLWSLAMDVGTTITGREKWDQQLLPLTQFEDQLGIKLKQDIIDSIGDTFVMYSRPPAIAGMPGETVVILTLKDAPRFSTAHEKLAQFADAMLAQRTAPQPGQPAAMRLQRVESDGVTVFTLTGMPINPSWCIHKNRLFVALSALGLKAAIQQADSPSSLLDNADFKSARAKLPQPAVALSYDDTRQSLATIYNMIQTIKSMLSLTGAESFPVDFDQLPSLESLQEKVFGGLSIVTVTPSEIVAHQYTPLGFDISQMGGSIPILAGVALPALATARMKARQFIPPMAPPPPPKTETPSY